MGHTVMGPHHSTDRRSFLVWVINALGALLTVILGVPIVAYLLDPRNRPRPSGAMKPVSGVRLGELSADRPVLQGVISDVRRDAWTLHPNDVLGRVWVVLQAERTIPAEPAERLALSSHGENHQSRPNMPIKVFTTICPHLGCSVNLGGDGKSFLCPCHAAEFTQTGERADAHNPARRGMDELEWRVDPDDPDANRLLVSYKNFRQGETFEKRELGS